MCSSDLMPPRSACLFCPYHGNAEWARIKGGDPAEWARVVRFDQAVRGGVKGSTSQCFLHRSLKPIDEVDFGAAKDAQMQLWNSECEGMCGV